MKLTKLGISVLLGLSISACAMGAQTNGETTRGISESKEFLDGLSNLVKGNNDSVKTSMISLQLSSTSSGNPEQSRFYSSRPSRDPSGELKSLDLSINASTCLPISEVIAATYAAETAAHGAGYSFQAPFVKVAFDGDSDGCLRNMTISRWETAWDDDAAESDPANIPGKAGSLDGIIKLTRKGVTDFNGIAEILNYHVGDGSKQQKVLSDGYSILWARTYGTYPSSIGVDMVVADKPCFSLERAVSAVNAQNFRLSETGAPAIYTTNSREVSITIFPNATSPKCLGRLTAYRIQKQNPE